MPPSASALPASRTAERSTTRDRECGTEALYDEYQERGGKVHPNGPLQTKPWGTKEFGAIDPNSVCVTFQE